MKPLPHSFYLRPTLQVARDILGKRIVRIVGTKVLIGKIVEVEAYCKGDPASHAFRGRTKRNDVMFWEGGHVYVYFTYGMHWMLNAVCEAEGFPAAVLIRAVRPDRGLERIASNRAGMEAKHWTDGPAKLCKAFDID